MYCQSFRIHFETGEAYEINEGHVACTATRFEDGATYDVAAMFENVNERFCWITRGTRGRKALSVTELDAIRDAEIAAGR